MCADSLKLLCDCLVWNASPAWPRLSTTGGFRAAVVVRSDSALLSAVITNADYNSTRVLGSSEALSVG